jgi:archaellum component FlaC
MSGSDFFDDDLVQRRGNKTPLVGQGVDVVGAPRDEMPSRPVSDLNLTRMAKHREEVNAQVATAKVEIERLRRRQTDLEREKQALEDLSAKQEQYEKGKQEVMDRLSESLVALEKLEEQVARLSEIYAATRRRHTEMLKELQEIPDNAWPEETFRDELNKALVLVDGMRKEFVKSQAAVEAEGGPAALAAPPRARAAEGEGAPAFPTAFAVWFRIGLAVTLPLAVIVALVAILVALAGGGRG